MPFKKLGHGKYAGPSGKHFDLAQVRLYYAGGGKFPGQKTAGQKNDRQAAQTLAQRHPKSKTAPKRSP